MKLADFIKPLSKLERAVFAMRCGTSAQHMRNIAFSGKSCGSMLAVNIDAESSRAVRRWDLRPTDWHRIWPELIGTEGAPDVPETPTIGIEARDAA